MICPYCKESIQDEALKCRYCGSYINSETAAAVNNDSITADEIRAFVATNHFFYSHQFSKFTRFGTEKFTPTWNWSCFGFTFLWMLYRKMYVESLVTFFIFCVPGVNVVLHVIVGVVGNYLYYRHVKEKIIEIRTVHSPQNYGQALQAEGGVHAWVITIGIIICIILALLFFLFFATITASLSRFSGVVI